MGYVISLLVYFTGKMFVMIQLDYNIPLLVDIIIFAVFWIIGSFLNFVLRVKRTRKFVRITRGTFIPYCSECGTNDITVLRLSKKSVTFRCQRCGHRWTTTY